MDIKVKFDAQAVAAAFEKSPDVTLTYIRRALLESCRLVQHDARYNHRFTARTGALERAITYRVRKSAIEGVIYIDDKIAPYGKFVHTGTRPHDIYPKNKKSLRWAGNSSFIFARHVRHPGTKPDEFLYKAADKNRQKINDIFKRKTAEALQEIGVK